MKEVIAMESIVAKKIGETIRIRIPQVEEEFVIREDVSLFLLLYNLKYGWLC
jgi:hypothetical protein